MKFEQWTYYNAGDLPQDWDDLAGQNPYLYRDFLAFIERNDRCKQVYHLWRATDGSIQAILLLYERKRYNLFMFTPIKASMTMTFGYLPLSVTRPGFAWREGAPHGLFEQITRFIQSIGGYKLLLNLPKSMVLPGFIQGKTCPRCILTISWSSLEEYLGAMRSSYRRRYRQALERARPMDWRWLDSNTGFTQDLYALYEQVYQRSPYKIEKLPLEFFQGEYFKIGVFSHRGKDLGFIQLLENGDELIFEFVGFDYEHNHDFDIYIRLLLKIVEYAIEHGFKTIDLGQTADEAKLKLGARYEYLYALLHHSLPPLQWLSKQIAPHIEYKPLDDRGFHVFREDRHGN